MDVNGGHAVVNDRQKAGVVLPNFQTLPHMSAQALPAGEGYVGVPPRHTYLQACWIRSASMSTPSTVCVWNCSARASETAPALQPMSRQRLLQNHWRCSTYTQHEPESAVLLAWALLRSGTAGLWQRRAGVAWEAAPYLHPGVYAVRKAVAVVGVVIAVLRDSARTLGSRLEIVLRWYSSCCADICAGLQGCGYAGCLERAVQLWSPDILPC